MGTYCLVGLEFLFGGMKKVWKWIVVMIAQPFECTNGTELYTPKWLKMANFMSILINKK